MNIFTMKEKNRLIKSYIKDIQIMTGISHEELKELVGQLKEYCYTLTTSNTDTLLTLLVYVKMMLDDEKTLDVKYSFKMAIDIFEFKLLNNFF